jgi:hypothetical protein
VVAVGAVASGEMVAVDAIASGAIDAVGAHFGGSGGRGWGENSA